MKSIKILFAAAIAVLCFASASNAQGLKMPQASSTQVITQEFGLGQISLTYSRPSVKGRVIFGGLVPFGSVWRTGANNATVIKFTDDVKMNGNVIPAGEYGFFTMPGKDEWTVIISKGSKQWGSYAYKEADDLVRFKVKPTLLKDKVETFTIQFTHVYPTSAQMLLTWDNTSVAVDLTVDIDAKVMANIETAMAGDKKPYFQAAQYYFENGKDLKKALEWVNAAEAADQKAPWIKLWKARMQLKSGDKKGAAATAAAGVKVAKEANNEEYVKLNTDLLAEASK